MKILTKSVIEKFKELVGWHSTTFNADMETPTEELVSLPKIINKSLSTVQVKINQKAYYPSFMSLGSNLLEKDESKNLPYADIQSLETLMLFMLQNNYSSKEETHLFLFLKSQEFEAQGLKEESQNLITVQNILFKKGYFVSSEKFKNLAIREGVDDLPFNSDDSELMLMQEKVLKDVIKPFFQLQRPYEQERTLEKRFAKIKSKKKLKLKNG